MKWSLECLHGISNIYYSHMSFCPVKELCSTKEEAASAEERFQKEVATVILSALKACQTVSKIPL